MQTDTAQQQSKAGIAAFAEKFYFNASYLFGFAPWDIQAAQPDLVSLVESNCIKGKSILDVGCGSGDNAIFLAAKDFAVTGLDYSKQGIGLVKKRAGKAGVVVDFQVYDAFKLTDL
jgi:2-polyprenyl-3-methyl-5-hydroxy-6-metoxy-1,4-benzoquinol methylase